MSRTLSRLQAVLLGLIVLTGLSLAVGGLFLIGNRGWYGADAFHVRAGFPEIRGVEVGTRVRLKGMDAGEVTAVLPPEKLRRPGGAAFEAQGRIPAFDPSRLRRFASKATASSAAKFWRSNRRYPPARGTRPSWRRISCFNGIPAI